MVAIVGNGLEFGRWNAEPLVTETGEVVTPPCTRSTGGSSAGHLRLEDSSWESLGGHAADVPKPPDLGPLDPEKQLFDVEPLPNGRVSHPIATRHTSHQTEEPHFGSLYSRSDSFGHYPKFMTIGESGKINT